MILEPVAPLCSQIAWVKQACRVVIAAMNPDWQVVVALHAIDHSHRESPSRCLQLLQSRLTQVHKEGPWYIADNSSLLIDVGVTGCHDLLLGQL
jgi:hypothetical protein